MKTDQLLKALRNCNGMTDTEISNFSSRNVKGNRVAEAKPQIKANNLIQNETVFTEGRSKNKWNAITK